MQQRRKQHSIRKKTTKIC